MDDAERERRKFQLDLHIGQFLQSSMITFFSIFFSAFISLLIASLMTGNIHFISLLYLYGGCAIFLALIFYRVSIRNIKRIEELYIPPPDTNEIEPISIDISVNLCEDESNIEKSDSPIKILLNLYMVIAGFASITAVKFLINANNNELRKFFEIPPIDFLAFLSFFLFIIPFYQGAITHLHDTYKYGYHGKKIEIMTDFIPLLAEGMVFFAISSNLSDIMFFISWLLILILIDSSFIIFVYLGKRKIPKTWIILNSLTFAFIVIMNILYSTYPNIITGIYGYVILVSFSFFRTAIDYKFESSFYWK